MGIYLVNLLIVTFLALITERGIILKKNENEISNLSLTIIIIIIIILSLISGLRYQVGTDFWTYEWIFYQAKYYDISYFIENIRVILKNLINFSIINISANTQWTFFFYGLFTNIFFCFGLSKKSSCFFISIYLYITTMIYYTAFNIVIQSFVSAFIFYYGYKYLVEKEFKKYFLIVIIASFIHNSAFIMILLYPLLVDDFKSKKKIVLIIITIMSVLFFNRFLDVLFIFLGSTDFGSYQDGWFVERTKGSNAIRVVTSLAPLILSIYNYKDLKNKFKDTDVLMNFSFLIVLVSLLSIKNVIFMRLNVYFNIYNCILLSHNIKISKENQIITIIIISLYFIYMLLLLPRSGGIIPYKTIFYN